MFPIAHLALAARSRSGVARKPSSPTTGAPPLKPSGAWLVSRMAAALGGSLVLIVSLVDPLPGGGGYEVHDGVQNQGVRHE
jgi:hypothetical protein